MMMKIKKAVSGVLAVCAVLGVMGMAQTYTRKDCKVLHSNGETVTVEDRCGLVWEFRGDGYYMGDTVNLRMKTNGTDTPFDDIVIGVY